tara:strand:- start:333 stop:509 length:177 start_codon:yes stop_codon:yes gene_type:complete
MEAVVDGDPTRESPELISLFDLVLTYGTFGQITFGGIYWNGIDHIDFLSGGEVIDHVY